MIPECPKEGHGPLADAPHHPGSELGAWKVCSFPGCFYGHFTPRETEEEL